MNMLAQRHLAQRSTHLTERAEPARSPARASLPTHNEQNPMKIKTTAISSALFAALALLLAGAVSTRAATLTWTNAASGSWNTAANWNPNQVPGAGDTAVITNAGVTVSLNSSTTVGGVILGTNGPGTVTLSLAGQTLALNGPLTVNPSGSFTVDSGALVGNTNAVLQRNDWLDRRSLEGILTLASDRHAEHHFREQSRHAELHLYEQRHGGVGERDDSRRQAARRFTITACGTRRATSN